MCLTWCMCEWYVVDFSQDRLREKAVLLGPVQLH